MPATKRITSTPEQERGVGFSPDGKALIYASERGNRWKIYETRRARDEEPYFYASTLLKETPLIENDKENYQPLYSPDDAAEAAKLFRSIPYHRPTEILPGITVTFGDAGHIIGSATVVLEEASKGKSTTLGFTGDLGNDNLPIVCDPEFMGDVDWLICESTYGGKKHESADDREEHIRADIARVVERGGKIIMPAFSVGRTQNIVFTLHKLRDQGRLPDIPVFVDSPLAVNATEIFRRHPETVRRHPLISTNPVYLTLETLPMLHIKSVKSTWDKDGNWIITWDPPYAYEPTLLYYANNNPVYRTTSVRFFVYFVDAMPELQYFLGRVPTHMGYLFVPKDIVDQLKDWQKEVKAKKVELQLQVRTNDNQNRTYTDTVMVKLK